MISPGSGASLDFWHVSLGVELVYIYGNVAPAILNPNDISDVWETPVNLNIQGSKIRREYIKVVIPTVPSSTQLLLPK